MKTLFIVNPAAGHDRGAKRWAAVESLARAASPGLEVWRTRRPADAFALAQRGLARGFEALFAVGGDGTLGEVVDGYLEASHELRRRACLGTWPVGSGCDFARHIGMKPTAEALLALLRDPRPRPLDAGRAEYQTPSGRASRHFVNVAAMGLAGDVALRVRASGKAWGGTLSYLFHSLAALACARARLLDLTIDGQPQPRKPYHLVVLANTSTFGGGMKVAPAADPRDGKFDMVTVGDLGRFALLRRLPLIYTGEHLGTESVALRPVRRLEASSPEAVTLNIDGEAIGALPASFELLPGALPFLCPT
jgi:YegS/Rv2252/BmrU family lipid kinase